MAMVKPTNIKPMDKAKVLMKDWLGNYDIMILAECGINKAIKIKTEIQEQIAEEGKVFTNLIRKERVLKYLGIDENYIYKQATIQQRLGL